MMTITIRTNLEKVNIVRIVLITKAQHWIVTIVHNTLQSCGGWPD